MNNWEELWYKVKPIILRFKSSIILIERTPEIQHKAIAQNPEVNRTIDDILLVFQEALDNAERLHKDNPIPHFNPKTADRLLRIASGDNTALWEKE